MSLSNALGNALSGLRFTSVATSLTSANIANAGNAAYTRKRIDAATVLAGGHVSGVAVGAITREYDAFVQRQLVTERGNGAYAATRATFLTRLDEALGAPGSARALDTVMNELAASFQTLQASPESATARSAVINAASVLGQTLRTLSSTVQSMRLDAERGLGEATATLNSLLGQLADTNDRLRLAGSEPGAKVALLDQRDALVDQISQLVDLRVSHDANDGAQLYGANGFVLLSGGTRPTFSFDGFDPIGPTSRYDADPAKRSVGTITAASGGGTVDLIAAGVFKSGTIGALIELRDRSLVAAQDQLDQIAAGLAQALGTSTTTTAVTMTGPGPSVGFDMALGPGLSDGDTVTVELTANGVTQRLTFKRVDDAALPMSDAMTADAADRVFRLTGSSAAGHASQMQAAIDAWAAEAGLPAGAFAVTATGGALRILADPAAGAAVGAARAVVTARTLSDGGPALPFFVDTAAAGGLFSDRLTASGAQVTGLAARIDVNAALVADPGALVLMTSATPDADATRPAFLNDALRSTTRLFAPAGGIGTAERPFQGSVLAFTRTVIAAQANEAATAKRLDEGQQAVVTQLQARYDAASAVHIDDEMAMLIQLQTSYGANARVMSAVREMFEMLRQM